MVMHARKPQRINDGYFEKQKHQTHPYQSSKYSSKRDYEREASRSSNYVRERDNSPIGGPVNNGNNLYRTDSPELDSPRETRDRDRDRERDRENRSRDRDRDRYPSSSYIKMRDKDRERDGYKKDKYSECLRSPKDKRDRRDREAEHRTNHDRIESNRRSSKVCNQPTEKRGGSSSNSDDRDRDRERDRERERSDRDRERVTRIGDWSEHVSSSAKKYYYNCKTEVSQWEKPREWLEKERMLSKEQHREYKGKERERDREDRFPSRSSYAKHSSSRGTSRIRWPHDADGPPSHRRRHDDSQDMDISPGDSTPTSEASYSHSNTPTIQNNEIGGSNVGGGMVGPGGQVLLATALPRLASHPSTPNNSQLHFTSTSVSNMNTTATCTQASSSSGNNQSLLSKLGKNMDGSNLHNSLPTSSPSTSILSGGVLTSNLNSGTTEMLINSNAPGPPTAVTLASLPKILSQITGNKTLDQNELNPQKALQTINNALLMSGRQQHNNEINSNSNSLREHTLNSPLYNLSHLHSMSLMNHSGGSPYVTPVSSFGQTQLTAMKIIDSMSGCAHIGDGPPTPTQELDMGDHRKMEGASASLSSLSSQVSRCQGPCLTPSLANYLRADLIAHVTGWPAEILEKQTQKFSEESHIFGDIQCTRVSADLKIARSLVRITEITATLQEQKVMYLRQQIRRLEELKSQNSFMSDDL